MNNSIPTAHRTTHLKIVAIALSWATLVTGVAIVMA